MDQKKFQAIGLRQREQNGKEGLLSIVRACIEGGVGASVENQALLVRLFDEAHADRGWLLDEIAEAQAAEKLRQPNAVDMSLEAIEARHKAVYTRGWRPADGGLEAHADRGELLARFDEARKKERAAHPLRVVTAPAEAQWLADRVAALEVQASQTKANLRAAQEAAGEVLRLEWGVRDETSLGAKALINLAVAHGFMAPTFDVKKPAAGSLQRPRVGPWVKDGGTESRVDANGHDVGGIHETAGKWAWWVKRPFAPEAGDKVSSPEEARGAVDAVLVTWADLDGVPVQHGEPLEAAIATNPPPTLFGGQATVALSIDGVSVPDALSQARALLQMARPLLNMIADDLVRPADEAVRAEIDAFLAGLSDEHSRSRASTWTEEQIREAWCTHKADPDEAMIDAVLRELRDES